MPHELEQSAPLEEKVIPREAPDNTEANKALVTQWQTRIMRAKAHWKNDFKRMRKDMEFAKLGSDGEWKRGGNYTANILQRHINTKVATLYAKNPRISAKRRPRLEFSVWDEKQETLQLALQTITINPADENAAGIIQDAIQGLQRRTMFDKIGKTVEILFHYYMSEGGQLFKRQAKQAVRRALVTGIAFCELGFQRLLEKRPEITAQIEDASNRLAAMEALSADIADGEIQPDAAEAEKLRIMLQSLRQAEEIVVREGMTFDWPSSTEIIIDPNTKQIEGWIGTNWLAREFSLTTQEIKETWQVDISKGGDGAVADAVETEGKLTINTHDGNSVNSDTGEAPAGRHLVWKVWDKSTGQEFVMAKGWPAFIKEPATPDVQIERFFPVMPLQFNPVEDDQEKPKNTRRYGLSEIELLRDMQGEYNRARQGLRAHRWANRPNYATMRGLLEDEDREALRSGPAHGVVELNSLLPGQKVEDILNIVPKAPIDPALYDVSPLFADIQRTSGTQEANLGRKSGTTATEASITEGSRVDFNDSNIDDLDDFLTLIARSGGQILFLNMSRDQVTKIAGPGAIWPEFSASEVADEVFLGIQAGSSGRPNRQLELANFERVAPLLIQIPGIKPAWMVEQIIDRLGDSSIDLTDAFLEGLPSIIAQNALSQVPAPGPEAADRPAGGTQNAPEAQGGAGPQNTPVAPQSAPGPQAAFPASGGLA